MNKLPYRVGFGFDVHRLEEGYPLWLGGIRLEHDRGLEGHSDADVLLHSICDALLGAVALGDIGVHFPPTDMQYKGIDSKILLSEVCALLDTEGYVVGNIDATIAAEYPKLNPHIPQMRAKVAEVMGLEVEQISIKATTTERLGFTGRQEGMSAYVVALVMPKS